MTMGVRKYTKEVIKEAKRVRWPKRDVFLLALVTTIIICVVVALILRFEDLIAVGLIDKVLKEGVFKDIQK